MSLTQLKKKTEGFTIIEVLIVLAIAGLIMVIVFVAIPQLQRSQRNNARDSDAALLAAAVSECMANRNGVTGSCQAIQAPANLKEITAAAYNATANTWGTTSAGVWTFDATCNPDGNTVASGASVGDRQFAFKYQVEGGGGTAINKCIAG